MESSLKKKTKNEASFRVNSIEDLTNCVIPHFSNYPLLTQKSADFLLFSRIIKLINNKMHLNEEGLLQIINLRASINLGLSNLLKSKFKNYKPVARPVINYVNIIDLH